MIVALSFNVGIGHEEHGQDEGDDVPSREDEPGREGALEPLQRPSTEYSREGPSYFTHVLGIVPGREGDHGRNLQEADLKSVSRTYFHTITNE